MFICSNFLYFPETMTNFLALLFVLVLSMAERSGAVSCYNCEYDSFQPQEATCTQPFVATGAPTCNGPACVITFLNLTGKTLSGA